MSSENRKKTSKKWAAGNFLELLEHDVNFSKDLTNDRDYFKELSIPSSEIVIKNKINSDYVTNNDILCPLSTVLATAGVIASFGINKLDEYKLKRSLKNIRNKPKLKGDSNKYPSKKRLRKRKEKKIINKMSF